MRTQLKTVGMVGLLWALASVVGAVTADRFSGAAAIYVPVGAATALAMRRRMPAAPLLLGVLLGQCIIGVATANLQPATFANALANGLEVLLASQILIRAKAQRFEREQDVLWLALAAVSSTALGATVGTAFGVLVNGDDAVSMFRAWITADLLSIILIVPGASFAKPTRSGWRALLLTLALFISSSALAGLGSLQNNLGSVVLQFAAWFALIVLVLVAGVRIGVQAMAVVQAPAGIAAFASLADVEPSELLARQLLAALMALTLAAVTIGIRRQTALRARSELMGSDLFRLSPVPTALVRCGAEPRAGVNSVSVNGAFERFLGPEGSDLLESVLPVDVERVAALFRAGSVRRSADDVQLVPSADGEARLAHVEVVPVAPVPGIEDSAEFLVVLEEVAAERRMEHLLRQQARVDPLTGLRNRRAMVEDVNALLSSGARTTFAVLLVTLDGFDAVNDRHGRRAGDDVICLAAERLLSCTLPDDLLGRMGGDEFAIVRSVKDERAIEVLVDTVRAAFAPGLQTSFAEVPGGCSVGWAIAEDGDTVDSLLHRADNALYLGRMIRRGSRD